MTRARSLFIYFLNKEKLMYSLAPVYTKQNFHIFYGNMLLPEADFLTFQDLGEGWGIILLEIMYYLLKNVPLFFLAAKDTHRVFYMGHLVPNADPFFIKLIGSGYAKDMNHVFYMGHLVPNADPFFFKTIDFDYAEDNHRVYLHGQILPTDNASSFVPPSNSGTPIAPSSSIYPPVMTPVYVHPTISHSNHMIPPMYPSNHSITPVHHPNHMTTSTHQPNQTVLGGYLRSNDSVHSCILI